MNQQVVFEALQHTPLPERMANFERTRAPQEALPSQETGWLIVEYKHLFEDVRFQVLVTGETARFQIEQNGLVTPLQTMTIQEAGSILRRDLLMILEDLEDEM